ncbi:MAG: phosphatidylserine decarboxylase [Alphaproteobacteria bacterium RIFCSPLOWO2_01_FULL_40_26]|nr:MAG: phosphatidylserine decarboxylase [Alphaproteobacteria bacterium RIFCSPHIGHO2_02_FULL_40_34]OFW88217.1 MAG: phosphatidylserine decarboxylase [Alphaproteobacteria bacterium RIFCSPHIGHO2_01_FULL_40_8]OFW94390.1 MAG: phosphatidylserine decarboxylase [Alphaproteobacteria bacterium RIFCSPLOWO2_01_FULL_40_26]OFX09462.1 MAG: phosphatidylserine decarboxylase [Alphaproteobacteria bacterium RIFCSPLOWO2_02_FULL_40_19]OFX11624.1 MAG: phosphatidylserine decarboxylase [Alphaproteobacteria bacterium RI
MNDLFDALKLVTFPIHKEGYKFILIFALLTAILSLMSSTLGLIGLVLTLWCVFFFRDPERVIPVEENVIVSPADGVITRVEYSVEAPEDLGYGNKKFNKISVFLNVFNVHVNRAPISGTVVKINYKPGKFLSANAEDASSENERNSVIVRTADGTEVIFVQVAGLVARRIICDLEEGQQVATGERYGIIRFGSRADIYLPENIEIKSLLGQTMIGGETVIAKL